MGWVPRATGDAARAADDELAPLVAGMAPQLVHHDGVVGLFAQGHKVGHRVGQSGDELASLVTYRTRVTPGSRDALLHEGDDVIGWLLLDGEGRVLGRLANSVDPGYDPGQARRFAKAAGIDFRDWGEVPVGRIDDLMSDLQQRGKPSPRVGTRRTALLFAASVGGYLAGLPWLTKALAATVGNVRLNGLLVLFTLVSGLLVGAGALWLGKRLSGVEQRVLRVVAWGLALAATLGALAMQGSLGITLLGLALILVVLPLWAGSPAES